MTDDNLVEDKDYKGIGAGVPVKNLEHWGFEDPDFYKKIIENIYRRQLIGNSGFKNDDFQEISLAPLKGNEDFNEFINKRSGEARD